MNKEPLRIEIDERPDIEYSVELWNKKHQRTENYTTWAKDERDVQKSLDLFTENGYDFLSIQRTHDGGHEPTHEEYEKYLQLGAELHQKVKADERERSEWER
jgi:hypothetical protein